MRPKGQVSEGVGGELWLSETKPSEMARNAFKTNMVLNILLATENVAIKKLFSTKRMIKQRLYVLRTFDLVR